MSPEEQSAYRQGLGHGALIILLMVLICVLTLPGCSCLPIDCQDPDHPPHYGRDGHNECSKENMK